MGATDSTDDRQENDIVEKSGNNDAHESFGVTVEKLDQVLTNETFWAQVHVVGG